MKVLNTKVLVQKYKYCVYWYKSTNTAFTSTKVQIMTLQKYKYTGWGCLCSLAMQVLSLLAFTSTKVQILTLCLVNKVILRTRYILILLALLEQKYKY